MKVNLSSVDISYREHELINEVLESGIYSIGPKIQLFEQAIAEHVGVKHAIAVNSGTSGLHLLVRALGIKEGDEVITSPFSFVASTNCILYEKARPVFVDIDPVTFNIDVNKIEEKITPKTKAILPIDVFGHPVDIIKINQIAKKYNLIVIEDSCEALGSAYKGIKCGSMADGAVFAFYANKQITTAEGGVIVTNSDQTAELSRSMRSQGRSVTGFWLHHDRLGFNYRMSEFHAALGVAQMERFDEILKKRSEVADMYYERLADIPGIKLPYIEKDVTTMSWFVYVIRVDEGIDRNKVMAKLMEKGVSCRPYFTPIHMQPYIVDLFDYKPGDFSITEKVSESTIALPFYSNLKSEQVDYVTDTLKKILAGY